MADISVTNHGSIVTLCGVSRAGAAWLAEYLDSAALRWGAGYVVEPRYVDDILEGAHAEGLEIKS